MTMTASLMTVVRSALAKTMTKRMLRLAAGFFIGLGLVWVAK
jgi:hypothetical protein